MRPPKPLRSRAQLENYTGLEAIAGAAVGLFSLVAGALGWYGVSAGKGRRGSIAWLIPSLLLCALSVLLAVYFVNLYSGDAETETRFFIILVAGCLAPWAVAGGLVIMWNRARKRRLRGGMSGSGLL